MYARGNVRGIVDAVQRRLFGKITSYQYSATTYHYVLTTMLLSVY